MSTQLNPDYSSPARIESDQLEWTESPSAGVWRKRLEHVGPAESGRVTSVVRYDAGSSFSPHGHPDGEEIFVLEGVFEDERGEHPAGTWLFNPEGFSHSPGSKTGCTLFVKLRQSPGKEREGLRIDTKAATPDFSHPSGFSITHLMHQPPHPERVYLLRVNPGATVPTVRLPGGAEFFVIEGSFDDEMGHHPTRTWLRYPPGSSHTPRTEEGCLLYVRKNHMGVIKSAS